MKIFLVSRTLSKLQTVAKEIEEAFNVDTAVIAVDFTSGQEFYEKIKKEIAGKEIGVLVNNVGMGLEAPDYFLEIPDREKLIQNIINCNITSVPMMCSIIMPQMVQRKKGVVINIASISALLLCPGVSIYSASKAFVDKFTEDLAAEYEHQGIIIQSVLPGPVATNMTKIKTGNFIIPSANDYVARAIKTVGFADHTTGYWFHSLMVLAANASNFLVPSVYRMILRKVLELARSREIKAGRYKK
jgi:17beta-estradiol 17-dehydrogenase / very-long-chain 3-oxoacyl-CoA reductase